MKKLTLLAAMSLSFLGYAQVDVTQINKDMRKGSQPCYELSINDVVHKDIKKAWMKNLGGFTKVKPSIEDLDVEFYDLKFPSLTVDTLNNYSRILQRGESVIIQSFFESETGFLSDSNNVNGSDGVITAYLQNFGKEMYNSHYLDIVDSENKVLKKRMSELDDLNDLVVKQTKLINKRETGIRNNQSDIENTVKEIEVSKTEVLNQNTLVSQISATSATYKSESKKLKSLQKKNKKLMSKKASLEKEIGKFHSQIEAAKISIEKAKQDIKAKEVEISTQKAKVKELNAKII
ncbi:MAG: hypothetical protein ACPG6V_10910 [Flavobacteriales bacterium]